MFPDPTRDLRSILIVESAKNGSVIFGSNINDDVASRVMLLASSRLSRLKHDSRAIHSIGSVSSMSAQKRMQRRRAQVDVTSNHNNESAVLVLSGNREGNAICSRLA